MIADQPFTHQEGKWFYGVWYCGTSWQKVSLYGQYPPTFLRRAKRLFPEAKKILHCPSGLVHEDITVDIIPERKPYIIADARDLPFRAETFDLILSDPPYSREDSQKYGCAPFPMKKFMAESHRILVRNGYLGILHTRYPSYSRKMWSLCGLIAVITGFQRVTRIFSIFEKISEVR